MTITYETQRTLIDALDKVQRETANAILSEVGRMRAEGPNEAKIDVAILAGNDGHAIAMLNEMTNYTLRVEELAVLLKARKLRLLEAKLVRES